MPIRSLAFVAPRLPDKGVVGGGETLLWNLATRAAESGYRVDFLTTCARDHFTWRNEFKPGCREVGKLRVHFFPVNEDRDLSVFLKVQEKISRGMGATAAEEELWLRNNVNSTALLQHLQTHAAEYDRLVMGPYLFGLIYFAAQVQPHKTFLVPCLHNEPFAYLRCFAKLFEAVRAILFNSVPERDLAMRLYGDRFAAEPVVGMGLHPFSADPREFLNRYHLAAPYVIYCGRREPLKGTPLLLDYMVAFRERTGRDIKLVLTGSGPVEVPPTMRRHLLDLGFVSEEEKHAAMAGAVAFCHPSLNESLGIVLLEAWLAGTPALVHAASDVLRFQCERSRGGLWFRMYPEFEEELLLLLQDERLRRSMAAAGRDYVLREYSWSAVESRFFAALEK
ncbi:MAG: glycosyltransferase family 4 protein [Kiritimatiellia bacterium]